MAEEKDIVERLLKAGHGPDDDEAAHEILRLRSLLKEGVEALERVLKSNSHDDSSMDYSDWSEQMKSDRDEYHAARAHACNIISKAKGE